MTRIHLATAAAALAATAGLAGVAAADEIYATEDPFGSPFGMIGFDVGGPSQQRVGVRFIPDADYRLDRISVWFMSNDFGGPSRAPVRITIETDDPSGGESIPSGEVIEELGFEVSAIGWDPVLEVMDSAERSLLREGVRYWVVATSDVTSENPVWNWAHPDTGFTAIWDRGAWQAGGEGAVGAIIVEGTLDSGECYADCDESGDLDFFDFLCFQNAFAAGDPYADCDESGDLDFFDFLCFQNEFSAGCP